MHAQNTLFAFFGGLWSMFYFQASGGSPFWVRGEAFEHRIREADSFQRLGCRFHIVWSLDGSVMETHNDNGSSNSYFYIFFLDTLWLW